MFQYHHIYLFLNDLTISSSFSSFYLEIILESLPKIDFPTASSMASVGTSRIPRSKVSFHSNKHRILEKQSHRGLRNDHDPNQIPGKNDKV